MRIGEAALRRFAAALLGAYGADTKQARVVAAVLAWADRVGRAPQGVWRLPILTRRIERGLIRCPCRPRLERRSAGLALLHGDGGAGHYLGVVGMRAAVSIAREGGVGLVAVRDGNFLGPAGFYARLAARAGMLGLAASNSFPKVAAHGGTRPVLGTNPIAFAAPRAGARDLLVDLATSERAGSAVTRSAETGAALPAGVAVDREGRAITDARRVHEGAILPLGGAKGFGLGLLVEVLAGVLTGAGICHGVASMYEDFERSGGNGHLLAAIDIARLLPLPLFHERMEDLARAVRGSGERVRLPGEARWDAWERNGREGIALDPGTVAALEDLATRRGVAPPWPRTSPRPGPASAVPPAAR